MVDPMPMIPTEEAPMEEASAAPTAPAAEEGMPSDDPMENATDDIRALLEARMNEIPDNQKEFILQYLTPETLGVLGIILGNEAVEFFAPFTDPSKMTQIVPRPQEQLQAQPQGPQAGPMAQPPAGTPQAQPPVAAAAGPSMAPR